MKALQISNFIELHYTRKLAFILFSTAVENFTAVPQSSAHYKCDQKRAASRKLLLKNLDNHLLTSVIFVWRNRVRIEPCS